MIYYFTSINVLSRKLSSHLRDLSTSPTDWCWGVVVGVWHRKGAQDPPPPQLEAAGGCSAHWRGWSSPISVDWLWSFGHAGSYVIVRIVCFMCLDASDVVVLGVRSSRNLVLNAHYSLYLLKWPCHPLLQDHIHWSYHAKTRDEEVQHLQCVDQPGINAKNALCSI